MFKLPLQNNENALERVSTPYIGQQPQLHQLHESFGNYPNNQRLSNGYQTPSSNWNSLPQQSNNNWMVNGSYSSNMRGAFRKGNLSPESQSSPMLPPNGYANSQCSSQDSFKIGVRIFYWIFKMIFFN